MFTVPLLVLIFCSCSRQVSVSVLLQTLVDPDALDMFGICLSSCRDWWCVSGQSFMMHIFFAVYTRPMSDLKTRPASVFLFQQRLFVKRLRRADFTFLSGKHLPCVILWSFISISSLAVVWWITAFTGPAGTLNEAVPYSMAPRWLRRNLRTDGNLLVLSTVLLSALTISAHLRRMSAGCFFSMILTELVVVISDSRPNLFYLCSHLQRSLLTRQISSLLLLL